MVVRENEDDVAGLRSIDSFRYHRVRHGCYRRHGCKGQGEREDEVPQLHPNHGIQVLPALPDLKLMATERDNKPTPRLRLRNN